MSRVQLRCKHIRVFFFCAFGALVGDWGGGCGWCLLLGDGREVIMLFDGILRYTFDMVDTVCINDSRIRGVATHWRPLDRWLRLRALHCPFVQNTLRLPATPQQSTAQQDTIMLARLFVS